MQVVLAERHETPVVQINVEFPGGYAADVGKKLGTASFALQMMDEGAGQYGALALAARKEALGAELSTAGGLDSASVGLSALTEKLEPSLDLLADVLRRPTFDPAEIERVRATWIAGIKQEKARPQTAALRRTVEEQRTTLRLGTVTDVGVVLDGEDGPVQAVSMGALSVDDRVLTAQHGRRLYALGHVEAHGLRLLDGLPCQKRHLPVPVAGMRVARHAAVRLDGGTARTRRLPAALAPRRVHRPHAALPAFLHLARPSLECLVFL